MKRKKTPLYSKVETADDIEQLRKMRLTVEELELIDIRRDYEALRKAYFKGIRMPAVESVAIHFVEGKVLAAMMQNGSSQDYMGFCLKNLTPNAGLIFIRKNLGKVQTRMTLVHEMAHLSAEIKYGKRSHGHGELWQREMKRLANAGAFGNWW